MHAMSIDQAFLNAGQELGLVAWRIENLQVVPITSKSLHQLHVGDSYIFLNTVQTSKGRRWNLHFWLGAETTLDESGIAAYKSVELDMALGGSPVEYRECQNHESVRVLR